MWCSPRSALRFALLCGLSLSLFLTLTHVWAEATPTERVSSSELTAKDSKEIDAASKVKRGINGEVEENGEVIAQVASSGWSLSALLGGSSCIPSGEANCQSTYPGLSLGASTGYSWEYVGVMLDVDWATLTPSGEGSDVVTHRLIHVGLGLQGRFSLNPQLTLFMGGSLGPGWVTVSDEKSNSEVSWSTFWSDLRIDVGALKTLTPTLALEGTLSLTTHHGGSRCVLFQEAGPCSALSDLPTSQRDQARLLMMRVGARWTP